MARYRDDSQETAVAASSTWVKITAIAEETARAVSVLLFGLTVLHTDFAVATDSETGRATYMLYEYATIHDTVLPRLHARVLVKEQRRLTDQASERLRVLHTDSATAGDSVIDKTRNIITERATISDQALGQRHVFSLVSESARASDITRQFSSVLVVESASTSDWAGSRVRARVRLSDTAVIADELVDAHHAPAAALVERARALDAVIDHLHAKNLLIDSAVTEDSTPGELLAGQAWTANADTWAMSRYAPLAFNGLAVIGGVLYGTTDGGVYQLGAGSEVVDGSLTTGKVDIGQGVLAHPDAAYLEYELARGGAATLDVITTQSGSSERYSYQLESEPAAELTSGRFKLGRGLRGRHFSFVLRMVAQHAYVNDLSVESAPTKRRV